MSLLFENRKQMIVITHCLEVDNQRLMSVHSQSSSGEKSSLGAVCKTVTKHSSWRPATRTFPFLIVFEIMIEKILYLLGIGQPFESGYLSFIESVIISHAPMTIRCAAPDDQNVPLRAENRTSARSSSRQPRDNVHRMPHLTGRWPRLYYPVRHGQAPGRMARGHDWADWFAAAQESSAPPRALLQLPGRNPARLMSMLPVPLSVRSL